MAVLVSCVALLFVCACCRKNPDKTTNGKEEEIDSDLTDRNNLPLGQLPIIAVEENAGFDGESQDRKPEKANEQKQ